MRQHCGFSIDGKRVCVKSAGHGPNKWYCKAHAHQIQRPPSSQTVRCSALLADGITRCAIPANKDGCFCSYHINGMEYPARSTAPPVPTLEDIDALNDVVSRDLKENPAIQHMHDDGTECKDPELRFTELAMDIQNTLMGLQAAIGSSKAASWGDVAFLHDMRTVLKNAEDCVALLNVKPKEATHEEQIERLKRALEKADNEIYVLQEGGKITMAERDTLNTACIFADEEIVRIQKIVEERNKRIKQLETDIQDLESTSKDWQRIATNRMDRIDELEGNQITAGNIEGDIEPLTSDDIADLRRRVNEAPEHANPLRVRLLDYIHEQDDALSSADDLVNDRADTIRSMSNALEALKTDLDDVEALCVAEREQGDLLLNERDEARTYGEKLHDEALSRVVSCVYCGHQFEEGTPQSQDERLTAHIKVCEKHPMQELETKLIERNKMINSLQATLDGIYDEARETTERDTIMCGLRAQRDDLSIAVETLKAKLEKQKEIIENSVEALGVAQDEIIRLGKGTTVTVDAKNVPEVTAKMTDLANALIVFIDAFEHRTSQTCVSDAYENAKKVVANIDSVTPPGPD